ncbi:MAG: class I SAM-dependent rRNA methyltransferase, partial [Anaerolineae bacterium]|nr:class I SAM-dependent rRNA methyltransferase [Anaerolineae bacterium]
GSFLAQGYLNRRSQITVRLLSWIEEETIDRGFFRHRLEQAIAIRRPLQEDPATNAYRLVNAESDFLPGLMVDRYNEYLVVQFLTLGIERWKGEIVSLLGELLPSRGIYERSDVEVRKKEGLLPATGLLAGQERPALVHIVENGHRFIVDIKQGQKTGFYLDQRENRQKLTRYCLGKTVLNCFAYTGAFAVYAVGAGAKKVVNVESSAEALQLAQRNMALNGFDERDDECIEGDVFQVLRQYLDEGRSFDLIVLDPPKFAYSRSQVQSACRGYKDINLLAMQMLRPGGILFTFSCSGLISPELFQKVVFGSSVDAGRNVQIIEKLTQGFDHPILLSFPESEYLKGFICRVW